MGSKTVSDCEQAGLRGPVKSVIDELSTTEFDDHGKIRGPTAKP
jgi:hypothetical protein